MSNDENIQTHHCKLTILKENMQKVYKEIGIKWISHLPAIVDQLRVTGS